MFFFESSNFATNSGVINLALGFEAVACPDEGCGGVLAFTTAVTGFCASATPTVPFLLFYAADASILGASEANLLFKLGTCGAAVAAAVVVSPPR